MALPTPTSEIFMRSSHDHPKGTLHNLSIQSDCLQSNMLGDPTEREVVVYVPHGHDGQGLPLLVDLVGFTAGGPAHVNWKNFGENVPERVDRLIASGEMLPAVIAFPDCFTRLGGNQYINSVALGAWEDFLIKDMLPAIEDQFGCGGAGKRGVFGKSSGGYGSMVHAMLHADVWSAAACHSGDMAFELCYLPDMPTAVRALAAKDHSIEAFLTDFEKGPKFSGKDMHVLMSLAMAATYDPDPDAFCGVRLPVDLETCGLIEERWANWLKWDPVVMVERADVIDNLKSLKGLWLECGDVDQYNLVYGARRLHKKLEAADVPHVYEEFSDNHSSIDYRMDQTLPWMARLLSA
ncbi:alpha/beta hydrolase-fold protein [Cohaesibacter sp. CAU 1516]|uniref:alpha/beta hydrolase n=1 Tax=Cohaesibacter sp. CAU 1516 TaxID=2576038 RepID=UPI001FEEE9BB|nr:alpha/beta hydrolase-fold protein [Cohaesibacter sp. CAU 1516]